MGKKTFYWDGRSVGEDSNKKIYRVIIISIHLSFWRYFGWVQSKTNDGQMLIFEEREKAEFSGQSSETIKSTRMKGRRGQQIERLYNDQYNEIWQHFSWGFIVVYRPWFPRIIETWMLTWILISLNTKWSSSHFVNHKSAVLGCQKASLFIPNCASCG